MSEKKFKVCQWKNLECFKELIAAEACKDGVHDPATEKPKLDWKRRQRATVGSVLNSHLPTNWGIVTNDIEYKKALVKTIVQLCPYYPPWNVYDVILDLARSRERKYYRRFGLSEKNSEYVIDANNLIKAPCAVCKEPSSIIVKYPDGSQELVPDLVMKIRA